MANETYQCVTLSGLPLEVRLEWPFRRSTAGADYHVLHGDMGLRDGSGRHALVALNLSETVREIMPSLEQKDAEAVCLNALRKEVDKKQLEFTKSPKRIPVQFSSRHYDFKRNRWAFGKAGADDIRTFLIRKVYWLGRGESSHAAPPQVAVTDAADVLYLDSTREAFLEQAQKLAGQGLIALAGEQATATPALLAQKETIEGDMRRAEEELEKKHAFERG